MSKRERSMDIFDDMVPDKSSTDDTQTPDRDSTDDTLKRYDIRLYIGDWERLKAEAAEKGISVSALIRMIIREHLR